MQYIIRRYVHTVCDGGGDDAARVKVQLRNSGMFFKIFEWIVYSANNVDNCDVQMILSCLGLVWNVVDDEPTNAICVRQWGGVCVIFDALQTVPPDSEDCIAMSVQLLIRIAALDRMYRW